MRGSLSKRTQYCKVVQFLLFLLNSYPRTQTSWHPQRPCEQKHLVSAWERSWLPGWAPKEETPTECPSFPGPGSLSPRGSQTPSRSELLPWLPSPCPFSAWSWLLSPSGWVNALDGGRRQLHLPPARPAQDSSPSPAPPSAGGGARAGAPGGSGRQMLQLRGGNGPSPIIHQ